MCGIKVLDCTLRDGAHVNGGQFGFRGLVNVVEGLSGANVDIVEFGFLRELPYNQDVSNFPDVETACRFLEERPCSRQTVFSLMVRADQYDVRKISPCRGPLRMIRVAFYSDYLVQAIAFAKEVIAKGYRVSLNLINSPGNDRETLMRFIRCANEIMPYAVSIVDTFGVLYKETLLDLLNVYSANLDPKITLGLHVHENLSAAFLLATTFIERMEKKRNLIVDGSLMGMGRAPGNLCTELIANYLNTFYCSNYNIQSLMETIDNVITPIKKNYRWGYSPEFFLSAKNKVHRSYAEYLFNKGVAQNDIFQILAKIDMEHAERFDERYLESLIDTEKR